MPIFRDLYREALEVGWAEVSRLRAEGLSPLAPIRSLDGRVRLRGDEGWADVAMHVATAWMRMRERGVSYRRTRA